MQKELKKLEADTANTGESMRHVNNFVLRMLKVRFLRIFVSAECGRYGWQKLVFF